MTTSASPLRQALHAPADPPLRPLPDRVVELLTVLHCPPRLAAHLRAVHDVAHQLTDWAERRRPAVALDREAVLFGAATHDIGKVLHPGELSGPGSAHERAGRELLLEHGVEPPLARFAATHASWTAPDVRLEDLLVSLADKAWKGRRVPGLEDLVVTRLAELSGRPAWEEFAALDDLLTRVGEDADRRLAFQASFPVRG
ncbi:HD domain-containing protein [Streptomyces sp. UH6]|uniref:HD domain-containing protein n=1 Tax=Streptomyces sp. UH6 TaxID=2748379 RepID=UPI00280B7EE0|nr:HD domain-containing protein [Streptomyces sp. UH6]